MRIVLQRVKEASVIVNTLEVASINDGCLLLVGIVADDLLDDIEWLAAKIPKLRIFPDEAGAMNKSLLDTGGDVIVVSQFTLHASTKKGNRPSFVKAAKPEIAVPLYQEFVKQIEKVMEKKVQTGIFGTHMDVRLINDGPITIIIDSKKRE
jgi:D-tyrosyl-tRNA(Tyr) deacylase